MRKWSELLDMGFSLVLVLSLVAVAGSTSYKFLYAKDYNFIVEAPCDPFSQTCYVRGCAEDPDECLPNELSNYTRSLVNAADFAKCTDNSCLVECTQGLIACADIPCDPEIDTCSSGSTE